MKLFVLTAALVLTGCPTPAPVPPPAPDASDAAPAPLGDSAPDAPPGPSPSLDDCQRGCAALAGVQCTLGDAGADCAGFLRVINGGKQPNPLTRKPLTCADVAGVKTRADAVALGFVCP